MTTTRRRFVRRALVALIAGVVALASVTGCVGQLGRNDDKVQPGSKGPSAANQ